MSQKRFYLFLLLACLAGYVWIGYSFIRGSGSNGNDVNVCVFKHVTGLPCPSCGSTRSVLSLMKGDVGGSLLLNPFGLILMLIMVVSPFWILYDMLKQEATLFRFYNKAELLLKRKSVAIPAVMFVLGNWIWNIYKGL